MKKELRDKYKTLRKSLSKQELNDFSLQIFERFNSEFNLTNKNISIFLPIEKFNEVNTWYFINNISANFYLPVVQNKVLKHIKYENKSQLKLSDWGIEEPTYGTEISPLKFDIVVVPLLAYDTNGNRVGYGAGLYDGFLKNCNPNCKFIGVSFFKPENKLINSESHDIKLDICVTPFKLFRLNK